VILLWRAETGDVVRMAQYGVAGKEKRVVIGVMWTVLMSWRGCIWLGGWTVLLKKHVTALGMPEILMDLGSGSGMLEMASGGLAVEKAS
jgi:hypothetical protein